MQNIMLANGRKIPQVGFGTWRMPVGQTTTDMIKTAVSYGYRHIDCAAIYGNEKSVGIGIKECGIPREELFVTSKLWNTKRGYEKCLKAFEKTLSALQIEYLDLYLIHWPASSKQYENWKEINADTWRAFEELYRQGKVKAIGVSNFLPSHLEALMENAEIMPMVNQIEFHPGFMQKDIVDFCIKNNVCVEGWSPLGTGSILSNETLLRMASKYGKSTAQICLRWCIQNQVIPLPKSATPDRIKENLDVFDFVIDDKDMEIINDMEFCGGSGQTADEIDF